MVCDKTASNIILTMIKYIMSGSKLVVKFYIFYKKTETVFKVRKEGGGVGGVDSVDTYSLFVIFFFFKLDLISR